MRKFGFLVCILTILSGAVHAEIIINEDIVKAISSEMKKAMEEKDFSVIEKYIYPGTKIIIDLDEQNNSGEKEIGYDDFITMTKMSLKMIESIEIHDEIISITIDKEKNQATIEEKTLAIMSMMGMKVRDESISTTTYGIIDGEIKAILSVDQLLSSGPVE